MKELKSYEDETKILEIDQHPRPMPVLMRILLCDQNPQPALYRTRNRNA
jgi:hypothetical protein